MIEVSIKKRILETSGMLDEKLDVNKLVDLLFKIDAGEGFDSKDSIKKEYKSELEDIVSGKMTVKEVQDLIGIKKEDLKEGYTNSKAYKNMQVNYDIDGGGNPYKDLDKAKLKKKQASFQEQINDLKSKLSRGGSKSIKSEIEEYQLKLDQIKHALKSK